MADITDTEGAPGVSAEKLEEDEGRKDLLQALGLCLVAVVLVRSFLFEPFKIPSSSMEPTLQIGDHIFVSKFNYGLSLPFTKLEIVRWSGPQRGDIIVFLSPRDTSLHYIKRVLGVPGDIIQFRKGNLVINGEVIKKVQIANDDPVKELLNYRNSTKIYFKEFLGSSAHYIGHKRSWETYRMGNNSQFSAVPDNHYFVVGDNRDDSYDSRSWGFVPRENIKGKAQMIWMSLDQKKTWGKLHKVRWHRCGTLIH